MANTLEAQKNLENKVLKLIRLKLCESLKKHMDMRKMKRFLLK